MMNKNIFRQIRINEGLSQWEYAKALGLSQTFISLMENGHYPISDRTKRRVVSKFRVPDNIMDQLEDLKKLGS